jgi:hypothetical protein
VIGLDDVPWVRDRAEASRLPEVAVLSAMAHPELEIAEAAIAQLPADQARLYLLYRHHFGSMSWPWERMNAVPSVKSLSFAPDQSAQLQVDRSQSPPSVSQSSLPTVIVQKHVALSWRRRTPRS